MFILKDFLSFVFWAVVCALFTVFLGELQASELCLSEVRIEYPNCIVKAENRVIVGNREVYKVDCGDAVIFLSFAKISIDGQRCEHDGASELADKIRYSRELDESGY